MIVTELSTDMDGNTWTDTWLCEPPPRNRWFVATEFEWDADFMTRTISAWTGWGDGNGQNEQGN